MALGGWESNASVEQKERWRGGGKPCKPSFSGRAGVKAGEPAAPRAAGSEGANAVEGTLVLGYDRRIASSGLTSPSRAHPRQSQSRAASGERLHQICGDFQRPQSKAWRERRLSETGRLTEQGNRVGAGAGVSQNHR